MKAADSQLNLHRPADRRGGKWLVGILLFALAVRIVFSLLVFPWLAENTGLTQKSDGYDLVGQTLASCGGYRFYPDLPETMFLMPAYPLFLAGLFSITDHHLLAAQIANALLDVLTCYFIYRIGAATISRSVGFTAAAFFALYPGAWVASSRFVTEPMFCTAIVGQVFFFERYLDRRRWGSLIAAGLCSAAAALCKSVAGALPLFVLACASLPWFWRPVWRRTLVYALACASVTALGLVVWVMRNHAVSGSYVYPSSSGGLALYTAHVYATNPEQQVALSARQAATEVTALGHREGIDTDPRDPYPRLFANIRDEVRLDRLAREAATQRIAEDRAAFFRHVLGNSWRFWFGAPTPTAIGYAVALNAPLMALGLFGLFVTPWHRRPVLLLWACLSAYLWFGHVAILAVVRYSLTVMPFVCLLAAAAVCWIVEERAEDVVEEGAVAL